MELPRKKKIIDFWGVCERIKEMTAWREKFKLVCKKCKKFYWYFENPGEKYLPCSCGGIFELEKPRKKSENKEHKEQVKFFQMVKLKFPNLYESKLIFAVPNAAKRSKSLAAMMKAEGLQSGVSDIICLMRSGHDNPRERYCGLCIEMKIKPNKPTPEQKKFLGSVADQGYKTAVCYSADEAFEVLEKYLKGGE